MDIFSAEEFVRKLRLGEFDSRLNDTLDRLSLDELEQVAFLWRREDLAAPVITSAQHTPREC